MNGAVKQEDYYTYEDWLAIDDGNRYELIDGTLYMMSSPSDRHQLVSGEIFRQLANFLLGKSCRVFPAPFDVRLFNEEDTVVMPDIIVVCDPSKTSKSGCKGAPDLAIEILSPSTTRRDNYTKFKKYLRAGVKEYWIVDAEDKTVMAYRLIEDKYAASAYTDPDMAPVQILPGCEIDLSLVFRDY